MCDLSYKQLIEYCLQNDIDLIGETSALSHYGKTAELLEEIYKHNLNATENNKFHLLVFGDTLLEIQRNAHSKDVAKAEKFTQVANIVDAGLTNKTISAVPYSFHGRCFSDLVIYNYTLEQICRGKRMAILVEEVAIMRSLYHLPPFIKPERVAPVDCFKFAKSHPGINHFIDNETDVSNEDILKAAIQVILNASNSKGGNI